MDNTELLKQLNDFVERASIVGVTLTYKDKRMVNQLTEVLNDPSLDQGENFHESCKDDKQLNIVSNFYDRQAIQSVCCYNEQIVRVYEDIVEFHKHKVWQTPELKMLASIVCDSSIPFDQYIIADNESIISTNGVSTGILLNEGQLEPGTYRKDGSKVLDEPYLTPKNYKKLIPRNFKNIIIVNIDECEIVPVLDSIAYNRSLGRNVIYDDYIKLPNSLGFIKDKFMNLVGEEKRVTVLYNKDKNVNVCKLINPSFPKLTLLISSIEI